ncbi:MAG: hypothetical protein BroJett039_02580 [Chloroflexota bacterium]|nr:MAG: hypothetical protein BroJett039_02580 [Chloroflexota bacterium]
MQLIINPWKEKFVTLIREAEKSIDIAVPFLSYNLVSELLSHLEEKKGSVETRFIVRLHGDDFVQGVSDIRAYELLAGKARALRNLHAKVYLFNSRAAIISSANLTRAGLEGNLELGVLIDDHTLIKDVKELYSEWWDNSAIFDLEELRSLVTDLREIAPKETTQAEKQRQKVARRISRLAAPVRREPAEDESITVVEPEEIEFIKSVPVPQANDMAKVAQVPLLIANGFNTGSTIANNLGIDKRQGDYYVNAARALQLVHKVGHVYSLSSLGIQYVKAEERARIALLREAIINAPVFRLVAKNAAVDLGTLIINKNQSAKLMNQQIVEDALRKTDIISRSTIPRRAQTLVAWIRWLTLNS